MINIEDIEDIQIDGVDPQDYPDFCDAYFVYACWKENGDELTEEQLDMLSEKYPEILNEMAYESLIS